MADEYLYKNKACENPTSVEFRDVLKNVGFIVFELQVVNKKQIYNQKVKQYHLVNLKNVIVVLVVIELYFHHQHLPRYSHQIFIHFLIKNNNKTCTTCFININK